MNTLPPAFGLAGRIALVTGASSGLGNAPDLIVNNAGVAVSRPLLEQSEADWDGVVDTNLKGAWLVAQEGARRLVTAQRPGAIVNIASITGVRVAGAVAPYCASKAGLIHLTRAMALELARHRIRVNALAPGYVETELNQDFLASEAGAYITGSVICADGGHLVSSL